MASVEVIGLLCAGSVKYHEPLGRGGSGGMLSRPELAGLLAGLSSQAMNLAMAKYAGDLASERMLIAQVREWAAGVAFRDGWEVVRGRHTVCNMAAMAVFEVVRPNVCGRCKGSGWIVNNSNHLALCKSCDGATFKYMSGSRVANALGLPYTTYCRIWQPRYGLVLSHVWGIDASINRVLRVAYCEKEICA